MITDLLYTSGSPSTATTVGTTYDLLHNLTDYDYIQILYTNSGDAANYYGSGGAHPSQMLRTSDIINQSIQTWMYKQRTISIAFTDTTFTIVSSQAVDEDARYTPYVYKVYGIKRN